MASFIVSFLVAILSGLGIGGGGLLVIWLVLYKGTEQLTAQGINLIWFLFSSSGAMLVHLTKRKLNFGLILFFAAFGAIGVLAGSFFAHRIPPDTVRTVFGFLLLCSGLLTLFKG